MRKYRILSVLVLFACAVFAFNMLFILFDKMHEVDAAQKSVKNYKERMSAPVDALDPNANSAMAVTSGELIIPKLEVDCSIRSDTVNAYDAVYHYPQSAAYGQPGECGILGHRTTYSGLFTNIGNLEPGDKVIIKDLILKKVYTYEVTSNGDDIRWDYKSNPIKFSLEGEPRLLLVTCYPPGEKSAAYIVHCKLISTSSF
ncbi:MAG: sortase [Methanobacterium sp.]|nr:sortase [Methanobacterium sp.]